MTKEKDQLATLTTALESRAKIMKGLLPAHMCTDVVVNRMTRLALTGIMRQPKLFECTAVSVVKGVMDAAALGLDCSGLLGSAYLVPFRNNKTGKYEAQLIPGYRGFIDLAYRRGKVKGINAAVVYCGDDFVFRFGLDPRLDHIPSLVATRSDDNIIAAYAVAYMAQGVTVFEVVPRCDLDSTRARSKAKDFGPWVTDYAPMCKKTAVRRLFNMLPSSSEIEDAMALDARNDGAIDVDYELPDTAPEEAKGVKGVREDLEPKGSPKDQATENTEPYGEPPEDMPLPTESK